MAELWFELPFSLVAARAAGVGLLGCFKTRSATLRARDTSLFVSMSIPDGESMPSPASVQSLWHTFRPTPTISVPLNGCAAPRFSAGMATTKMASEQREALLGLTVAELRGALKKIGLPQAGRKADLVTRLIEAGSSKEGTPQGKQQKQSEESVDDDAPEAVTFEIARDEADIRAAFEAKASRKRKRRRRPKGPTVFLDDAELPVPEQSDSQGAGLST